MTDMSDREIDSLIAVRFFGFRWTKTDFMDDRPCLWVLRDAKESDRYLPGYTFDSCGFSFDDSCNQIALRKCPKFASSRDAAALVLEEIGKRGLLCELAANLDPAVLETGEFIKSDGDPMNFGVQLGLMASAKEICEAALAALAERSEP